LLSMRLRHQQWFALDSDAEDHGTVED